MSKINKWLWFSIALALAGGALLIFTLRHDSATTSCAPSNTIIVGTNAEFPPFSYIEQNQIVGFDIDIMQEVGRRMGKIIEWRDMPFDALIPEIQLGNIQMIAAGMTPTAERALRVLFTSPYLSDNPLIIITQKPNAVTSVADLRGKDVIVNEGFVADQFMSTVEGPILHRLATVAEGFLALTSDRAYAYVLAKRAAEPFFKKYGAHAFSVTEIPNTSETSALALSKQHAALLAPVQQALDAMKHDGTIATLQQKWNLND